jgi:hypothetical protein
VTISGTARGFLRGTTVTLWQELPGQQSFHQVASTTRDSSGAYKFIRGPIDTNRRWYVVAGGVHSNTVRQHVTAVVTLDGPKTAKLHTEVLFGGHVTPTHAGEPILLEEEATGAWRVVGSTTINHASNYTARVVFIHAGRVHLRALLPGDSRNARSTSRSVTVTAG